MLVTVILGIEAGKVTQCGVFAPDTPAEDLVKEAAKFDEDLGLRGGLTLVFQETLAKYRQASPGKGRFLTLEFGRDALVLIDREVMSKSPEE